MDDREEKIRVRAYEIWEQQGRTGDPEDHWLAAEREIKAQDTPTETSQDPSEGGAVQQQEAVEALEATSDSLAKGKGSRRPSKG